jgi:hypothetical protein
MELLITSIKPNPIGKDRSRVGATPSQLAAEWVDFRNDGNEPAPLHAVALYHRAYSGGTASWDRVTGFRGNLPVGKIVRVHAGRVRDTSVIRQEDMVGADYHIFSGEDRYVWNHREGDTPLLYNERTKTTIDQASYDPWPPEGAVLVRQGAKFVLRANAAGW